MEHIPTQRCHLGERAIPDTLLRTVELLKGRKLVYRPNVDEQFLRASGKGMCPKIAPRIGPDSRRGEVRIVLLCKPCRNAAAGPIRKQERMTISFRGP